MTDETEHRHVVRLACGHELLQVVRGSDPPAPVGDRLRCDECGRDQPIVESFEVEP
jgi:hypothetical protein